MSVLDISDIFNLYANIIFSISDIFNNVPFYIASSSNSHNVSPSVEKKNRTVVRY